jgi:hypothetical protein
MAILKISKQDVLRQLPVEPGWYQGTVKQIVLKTSKDKQSMNFETTVTLDPDGRDSTTNFNTKAIGMAIPFLEACLGEKIPQDDVEFDTDKLVGKRLNVKMDNETYEGRIMSRMVDFLPIGADTTPAF